MRTTVTLDPDVLSLLKSTMREKSISFKEAINTAIRKGLGKQRNPKQFRQKVFNMGIPVIPLRKALQLAADMEDEEVIRDLTIKK